MERIINRDFYEEKANGLLDVLLENPLSNKSMIHGEVDVYVEGGRQLNGTELNS